MYRKYRNRKRFFINMHNYILITFNYIIWYLECDFTEKFALSRKITKIIQRYIFIFLNKKSSNKDFSYIQSQILQKRSIFPPIQSIEH